MSVLGGDAAPIEIDAASQPPQDHDARINKFDPEGKLRDEICRRGAEGWHTDGPYNQAPFKATQLCALAVPSRGGNTLFANAYAACDMLPRRLKERLEGVIGAFAYGGRRGKAKLLNPEGQEWKPVFHPIVRTDPDTGRKALYFDPGKIRYFVGIPDKEGGDLIAELSERMVVLDAEYHHIWRKGDVVIWDNRCPYHRAAGDWKTAYIAGLVAKQGRLRSVDAG